MFEERHMVLDVQYSTRQHPLQGGCRHGRIIQDGPEQQENRKRITKLGKQEMLDASRRAASSEQLTIDDRR
jgi:hypothetical protein